MIERLGDAERRLVTRELERLRREGPKGDPRLAGCMVAFAGMVLLTLTPALGGWLEIPSSLGFGILGVAVLLLLGGAAVGLVGSGLRSRGDRVRRDAARAVLDRWEAGGVGREEALRAAVRFLDAGGRPPAPGEGGRVAELLAAVTAVATERAGVVPGDGDREPST